MNSGFELNDFIYYDYRGRYNNIITTLYHGGGGVCTNVKHVRSMHYVYTNTATTYVQTTCRSVAQIFISRILYFSVFEQVQETYSVQMS